jgi:DNA-binding FadR family transcriptional regulator
MAGTEVYRVDAHVAFHRLLLTASGNELLKRLDVVVETDVAEHRRPPYGPPPGHAVRGHRAVLGAIHARDPDAAERRARWLVDHREVCDQLR